MITLLKNLATVLILFSLPGSVLAFGDQWYVGIGGGGSRLLPDPDVANVNRIDEEGQTATIFIGQDFDRNSSGQFQLYSLGEAEFNNTETATYTAAEATLLYRFYDSRSVRSASAFGFSVYGRFGFGVMDRESDVEIEDAPPVYFGVGDGVETYLTRNIGLRLEAQYLEEDASTATLSIVSRFGGRIRPTAPPPPNTTPRPTFGNTTPPPTNTNADANATATDSIDELGVSPLPSVELIDERTPQTDITRPTTPALRTDRDADGVDDSIDQCPRSNIDIIVNSVGCSVFAELAKEIRFAQGSASLEDNTRAALTQIARLLQQNPGVMLELIAHTDNTGNEEQQSQLARQRLRALGVYLVRQQGIDQRRLLLRSFAGTQPAFSNTTAAGRAANNRIEIKEGF